MCVEGDKYVGGHKQEVLSHWKNRQKSNRKACANGIFFYVP